MIRTPDARNIETPVVNEGVLNQEPKLDNKSETHNKSNLVTFFKKFFTQVTANKTCTSCN